MNEVGESIQTKTPLRASVSSCCSVRIKIGNLYLAFATVLDPEKNSINGSFFYYNLRKMHGRIIHMCMSLSEVLDQAHIHIHMYVHTYTNIPG